MHRRRHTIALSALPALLAAAIVSAGWPAQGAPFTDVSGEIARHANALGTRTMLPPVWGSVLAPHAPVYRYEMAFMMASLLDPKEHPFSVTAWPDVPPGHWALLAINRIVGTGVLKDEEGKFNGDRRIRRWEFVTALEKVLSYRSVPPPPPRKDWITFPDARGGMENSVDRAANFWQFLDAEPRFRPGDALTRGEAVAMMVKAAPLVDQTFMSALATPTPPPPTPTPKATARPRETPAAGSSGTPPSPDVAETPGGSGSPGPDATTGPDSRPEWTWAPIAWRVSGGPAVVAIGFSDSIVQKPGLIPLGGGDLDVTGWSGPVGGAARLGARLFPGTVPDSTGAGVGKTDYFYQVAGSAETLWNLGLPDADVSVGGGLGVAYQARTAVGLSSADRTFAGVGPAGRFRLPMGPLALEAGAQVHVGLAIPMMASAGIGPGFGLGYQLEGRYGLPIGTLEVVAGTRGGVISASGRTDALSGLLLGVGGGF